jgi:hypothetical protein
MNVDDDDGAPGDAGQYDVHVLIWMGSYLFLSSCSLVTGLDLAVFAVEIEKDAAISGQQRRVLSKGNYQMPGT